MNIIFSFLLLFVWQNNAPSSYTMVVAHDVGVRFYVAPQVGECNLMTDYETRCNISSDGVLTYTVKLPSNLMRTTIFMHAASGRIWSARQWVEITSPAVVINLHFPIVVRDTLEPCGGSVILPEPTSTVQPTATSKPSLVPVTGDELR